MRTVSPETKKNMTVEEAWDGEHWEETNAKDQGGGNAPKRLISQLDIS